MKIQNFRELAVTKEREAALAIAEAGLEAIDTATAVARGVSYENGVLLIQGKYFPLKDVDRIFIIGAGKCAFDAAETLERILGEKLTGGTVVSLCETELKRVKTFCGTHPFPTLINVEATGEIIKTITGLTERDLVLAIVSGGGSTMLAQPEKLTVENETDILKSLFKKGATIEDINILRKHISYARGGFLAQYAYPAQVVSLIFSDVPGNDILYIASGPTVKDTTTVADAAAIINKYGLEKELGIQIPLIETPKDDKYFARVWNTVLVSNESALDAMAAKAKELGFTANIRTAKLAGEARDVARDILNELHAAEPRTVLLYGGETTVTITTDKPGKGGRNLEGALSACASVAVGELYMTVASDGRDNSDFAGALCDIMTKEKARQLDIDAGQHLKDNASYRFFERVGDKLLTGETGSNVSDLIIAIKI